MLDEDEFKRWFESSRRTLSSARGDLERGDYNWACFKAQQAAELSVRALARGLGIPAYGHMISKILDDLSERGLPVDLEIEDLAKDLDKLYIPTRYPNAWVEGSPHEYYTRSDAERSIEEASKILEWVERVWESLRKGGGRGRK